MGKPKNMCIGCKAPCCTLLVELNTYDLNRIRAVVSDEEANFAELMDAADDDLGFKANGRILRFTMKRKPNGDCIFLNREGELHCRVYGNKPSICTTYPFKEKDGKVIVKTTVGCQREAGWDVDDAFRANRKRGDEEWGRYFEIIDEWNAFAEGYEPHQDFAVFAFHRMEDFKNPLWRLTRGLRLWIEKTFR
ncbi:MAG: YkgJ family cysteine cluster protein [Candidatus Micrarchaeota archaeon]